MSQFSVGDVSLEYGEVGEGEPVIFVHGSASDYRTWERTVEYFSNDFRTINYSRRYHWPNAPIDDRVDYAMSQQVADLKRFMTGLIPNGAHLVGTPTAPTFV